jgi:hypothetical protein
MFNKINKNFFIGSLIVHIVLIILILFCNSNNKINKLFVVYGAHSKKQTNTYFKSSKQSTKTNWNQNQGSGNKKFAQNSKPKGISKKGSSPIKETISKKHKKAPSKKAKSVKNTKNKNLKNTKSKIPELKKNKKKKLKTKEKSKKKESFKEPEKIKDIKIEEKQEEKSEEKKDQEKQPEPEQSEETAEPEQTDSQETEEAEELHFNLMGEQDPNLAIYQKHIQKEVERLWHPPIGVPKGTECTLSFLIDSSGNVDKFEIIKKSNVLIYDLSILRIAKNFKFNQSLWNKKFTIEFRQ